MSNHIFNYAPRSEEFNSGPIKWDRAERMHILYKAHPKALQIPVKGKLETMKGLNVKRTDIETIFKNDPGVDELFIMLALRDEDLTAIDNGTINAGEYDKQFFTTVLVGLKAGAIVKSLAIDYCEPCPEKCPSNL